MTNLTIDTDEIITAIEADLDREYRYQLAVQAYLERRRKRPHQRHVPPEFWYGIGCILLAVASALLLRLV